MQDGIRVEETTVPNVVDPVGLVFNSGRLWVSHRGTGCVSVIDVINGRNMEAAVSGGPIGIHLVASGDDLVAVGREGGRVTVIDGNTSPEQPSYRTLSFGSVVDAAASENSLVVAGEDRVLRYDLADVQRMAPSGVSPLDPNCR